MADDVAQRLRALRHPGDDADWMGVVRLARVAPRSRAYKVLAAAAVLAGALALVAAPALGLRAALIRAFEETEPAPPDVQQSFNSLDADTPPAHAMQVKGLEARKLVFPSGLALWIAPTARGGFCWAAPVGAGSCDATRAIRFDPVYSIPGDIDTDGRIKDGPVRIDGSTVSSDAERVEIRFADGTVDSVPVVWVTAPIEAGFFAYEVPSEHWAEGARPTLVILRDGVGSELARDSSAFEFPEFRRGPSTGVTECVARRITEHCLEGVPGDGRLDEED